MVKDRNPQYSSCFGKPVCRIYILRIGCSFRRRNHIRSYRWRYGSRSEKNNEQFQSRCPSYFPGLLNIAVGEREDVRRKPAPDTVLKVMAELNVNTINSVYVGDSEVDIETAANVGCDCIAVSWGSYMSLPAQLWA